MMPRMAFSSTGIQGLEPLLQEWSGLTDQERLAIEHSQWDVLARCHEQKLQLMQKINQLSGINRPLAEPVAGVVRDLQAREKANMDLLGERMQCLRAQISELGRSSGHLRSVRSAYRPAEQTVWQSYS